MPRPNLANDPSPTEQPHGVEPGSKHPAPDKPTPRASADLPAIAPPESVLPGHLLAARYEVLGILGEGGMGIVYGCRDQVTGSQVALKRVIPPAGSLAQEYATWFYKEARALAALDHPNIVRARDFGQLRDGSPFLVMDQVSGASLHALAQARLAFPTIHLIVDQILSALAHAHARGVVHGDLKPSNVLVEQQSGAAPQVHILDFGLAWLRLQTHDERLDGNVAVESTAHAGAGTPGYMAPEQIQHEMHHVTGATDLYALGCILYRLLGGREPFVGEPKELLRAHAFSEPPPLVPVIPAPDGVSGFVHRLLAKRPWDRWEFVANCRRDWAAWRPQESDPAVWTLPPVPERSRVLPRGQDRHPRGPTPDLAVAVEQAPGLLSIRPSPLVGRKEVRQRLLGICDEVASGRGPAHRLVLLVGAAGTGKSRLAEWLCEIAHEHAQMVPLRARYRKLKSPLDGMLGAVLHYYNFERANRDTIEHSLLERWRVRRDDKTARTWVAGAAAWLRPAGPNDPPTGPTGIRFTLDTLDTRRMVIRYTLRKMASGQPLLFWLDDLHNASPSTVEGLLRIHQEEPDQRIVIVATVRLEDVVLGAPVTERLRELRDVLGGDVIEVTPLPPETTAELLRASLPLDDAAVTEAARRSRGNPLFALQQLHAWAYAGNLELRNGAYHVPEDVLARRPQTTAEFWDSRIAALPEPQRPAAYAAAALGGDIRNNVILSLLASLGLPAEAAIKSLRHAEILIPRGPGRHAWPHELLQEHLLLRLEERPDKQRFYRAAAAALTEHPLASSRRVTRLRMVNLIQAGDSDPAAELLFDFLEQSWNSTREPLATLADLELLRGGLSAGNLAMKHRWQAEALHHAGQPSQATSYAELARTSFEELGLSEPIAHLLRLLGHLASVQGSPLEGLELVGQAQSLFARLDHPMGQATCSAVAGEIEYSLGSFEQARKTIQNAEHLFAALGDALGHGQCLLLLSFIEHSEGTTERSRRLAQEARTEFERAGYRLGIARADLSLSHVEHRLMNYQSAELGALDALSIFESFRTPRGEASCHRLLSMIGMDTDDAVMAQHHAERAQVLYQRMGEPAGLLEAKLLFCQIALHLHEMRRATLALQECARIFVEQAEARQHFLLTRAWHEAELGQLDRALESIEAAATVFGPKTRAGDHTPHLLCRLARFPWPRAERERIETWRALLNDRNRRRQG